MIWNRALFTAALIPALLLGGTAWAQDLKVKTSTVPAMGSTAGAGSLFTASYKIENSGSVAVTKSFLVRFYYCPQKAVANCFFLEEQWINQQVPAGGSVTSVRSMTLPSVAVYGTGYILITSDATNRVKETNETNNDRFDEIKVTTPPDLSVSYTRFPQTGVTDGPGSSFTGRIRVHNAPGTSKLTTNFQVRYFYCTSASYSAATCSQLGSQLISDDLSAGGFSAYINTPTLKLPSLVHPGTRYVMVQLDATNLITELNESNNTAFDAITISSSGLPDLRLFYANAPYQGSVAAAGSKFRARVYVRNYANLPLLNKTIQLSYYYCPTQTTATASCSSLGQTTITDHFNPWQGRWYTSAYLTLPQSALYGPGFIRFWVDSGGAVKETYESNNVANHPIMITTKPDLTVASVVAPASGALVSGASFSAALTVANKFATSAVKSQVTVSWFICPTKATAGCVVAGPGSVALALNSGGVSAALTSTGLKVPPTVKPGAAYLRAWVDSDNKITESSDSNNDGYTAVTVSAGTPDLAYANAVAVASGSAAAPGATFKAKVWIKNNSLAALKQDFYVGYHFCDSTSSTTCTQLAVAYIKDDFAGGQVRSYLSPSLMVPVNAKAGTRYVRFFLDATSLVKETKETNNQILRAVKVTATPDLQITALSAVVKQGSVTHAVTICNNGDAMAGASKASLYYNQGGAPTCVSTASTSWTVPALAKGVCVSKTVTRPKVKAGAYLGWALADSSCAVAEKVETNNAKSVAYLVTPMAPDQGVAADAWVAPDLQVVADTGVPGVEAGVAPDQGVAGPDLGSTGDIGSSGDTGAVGDAGLADLDDLGDAGAVDQGEPGDASQGDMDDLSAASDQGEADLPTGDGVVPLPDMGPGSDFSPADGGGLLPDSGGKVEEPAAEGCECNAGSGGAPSPGLALMLLVLGVLLPRATRGPCTSRRRRRR